MKAKCSLPHLKGSHGSALRKEEDEAVGLETSRGKKPKSNLKLCNNGGKDGNQKSNPAPMAKI